MDFTGKVAVVTGGGSGIGQACAREFATRRAAVAVVDRDATAGEKTASELRGQGGAAEFFSADVSRQAEVARLVPAIVSRFGGIDVLVNNAGIQRYGTVTTLSEEEWDEVMNVNLKSAFLMSKLAIPAMIQRGGGAVVNTGSVQIECRSHESWDGDCLCGPIRIVPRYMAWALVTISWHLVSHVRCIRDWGSCEAQL